MEDELCAYQEAYTGVSYTWYPETEFCYVRNKKAFLPQKEDIMMKAIIIMMRAVSLCG